MNLPNLPLVFCRMPNWGCRRCRAVICPGREGRGVVKHVPKVMGRATDYLLLLSREWMGCWGLLGLWFIAGWWLVDMFYFPIYWVANHPNWLSYFSEGWPNHQPVMKWILPSLSEAPARWYSCLTHGELENGHTRNRWFFFTWTKTRVMFQFAHCYR